MFFFRVRHTDARNAERIVSFDMAIFNRPTLEQAFSSVREMYPDALIFTLKETEFDTDGLPKLSARTIHGRNESGSLKAHDRRKSYDVRFRNHGKGRELSVK